MQMSSAPVDPWPRASAPLLLRVAWQNQKWIRGVGKFPKIRTPHKMEVESDPHQHLSAGCGQPRARSVRADRPRHRLRQPQCMHGQRGQDGEARGIEGRTGGEEAPGGWREVLTRARAAVERR
jgi:hypothetical protein